jgi:3-hydroxybutyryl-CoA dehydrogenase
MGHGIAQCFAQAGYDVFVHDSKTDVRHAFLARTKSTLERLEEKKIIPSGDSAKILSRFSVCDSLEALKSSDLVIEAVAENLEAKRSLFQSLESLVDEKCILASNTSSLPITALASACTNPARVLGVHFFNPAPRMPLVELVPGLTTEQSVVEALRTVLCKMNKQVVVAKDTPGFIVNRIARPFYGEALRMLEEGVADEATIDSIMREHGRFKMGPFQLMDLIGIDINFAVSEQVFTAFYFDPRYRPSIHQRRMVEAKLLGRKTKRGFYSYIDGSPKVQSVSYDSSLADYVLNRILYLLINEAIDACFLGVATVDDIETAMRSGVSYPKGLLAWAEEISLAKVLDGLVKLQEEYGDDRYRPSPLLRRMVKDNSSFFSG